MAVALEGFLPAALIHAAIEQESLPRGLHMVHRTGDGSRPRPKR